MHEQNLERASWAETAADAFGEETYCGRTFAACLGEPPNEDSDGATLISDLIGDLMHLAQRSGLDPHKLVHNGVAAYEFETAPDYQGD